MSSCIMAMSIRYHHNDVIMSLIASQITSLTIVYSTVYSDTDERKHQSFASLAFVRGIHHCEFPTQRASNAENVFIWWRHHDGDSFTAFQVWPFSTISFMLHAVSSTFDPFFHPHFFHATPCHLGLHHKLETVQYFTDDTLKGVFSKRNVFWLEFHLHCSWAKFNFQSKYKSSTYGNFLHNAELS